MICPHCGKEIDCPRCKGFGKLFLEDMMHEPLFFDCPECKGTGKSNSGHIEYIDEAN